MITIPIPYAKTYIINLIQEQIERTQGEYTIDIEDVDDLHDWTIESQDICQTDRVYDALCSTLPVILVDAQEYLDEAQDYWDGWAEYYRNIQ